MVLEHDDGAEWTFDDIVGNPITIKLQAKPVACVIINGVQMSITDFKRFWFLLKVAFSEFCPEKNFENAKWKASEEESIELEVLPKMKEVRIIFRKYKIFKFLRNGLEIKVKPEIHDNYEETRIINTKYAAIYAEILDKIYCKLSYED